MVDQWFDSVFVAGLPWKSNQIADIFCNFLAQSMEEADVVTEEGVKIERQKAFYNPAQQYTRTLSVKVISQYIKRHRPNTHLTLLECMSATGLRGLRYHKEITASKTVVMNDLSAAAYTQIQKNCTLNSVPYTTHLPSSSENSSEKAGKAGKGDVVVLNKECRALMYDTPNTYDIIDIDPFGTCSPYVEAAFTAIKDGGLLCVTSTDSKVLCGTPPESAYQYYGTLTFNGPSSHEASVRIILSYLSRVGSKSGCSITPLVSLSIDFFVRVFVIVRRGKKASKRATLANSNYYICKCQKMHRQPLLVEKKNGLAHCSQSTSSTCGLCGREMVLYGPYWASAINDREFIGGVLGEISSESINYKRGEDKMNLFDGRHIEKRVYGMLTLAMEEEDTFLFYDLSHLSSALSLSTPPLASVMSCLVRNGFGTSITHCKKTCIKTTAPVEAVYQVIQGYAESTGRVSAAKDKENKENKGEVHSLLLNSSSPLLLDFSVLPLVKEQFSRKLLKFQDHSGLNWGPLKK